MFLLLLTQQLSSARFQGKKSVDDSHIEVGTLSIISLWVDTIESALSLYWLIFVPSESFFKIFFIVFKYFPASSDDTGFARTISSNLPNFVGKRVHQVCLFYNGEKFDGVF